MYGIERRYQRHVDALVLGASGKELEKIQRIDVETQLSGNSFYDSYSNSCRDGAVQASLTGPGRGVPEHSRLGGRRSP